MVEVVTKPADSPMGSVTGSINGIVNFISINWPWFLVVGIIIILAIVIITLLNKIEEERKERDEPGYQLYKTVKMACDLNKDDKQIRKSFNPATLPLIFFPIFGWFLMFVIKKEHSARLVDYRGNLIGFYRGDFISMDNSWNFLVYKDKWLIFFEKTFVIKAPLGFTLKKVRKDKEGKIEYQPDKKTPIYDTRYMSLRDYIRKLPNGDYQIECTSIEPIGIYYKCPVYIVRESGEYIDYKKLIEGAITDNTYELMTTRLLNVAAKQMEKAATFSPDLQHRKQAPQKTKEEESLDQYEQRGMGT